MKPALKDSAVIVLLFSLCIRFAGCLPSGDRTEKAGPEDASSSEIPVRSDTSEEGPDAPVGADAAVRSVRGPPWFASRLDSGQLPPVEERLPEHPVVVTPFDKIGTYGGSIRRATIADIADHTTAFKTLNENLMVYDRVPSFRRFASSSRRIGMKSG